MMEPEENVINTAPLEPPAAEPATAAAAAEPPADPHPNKARYADGFVFNYPVSYWAGKTEDEVRRLITDAGTEEEHIEPRVALIGEALAFHGLTFSEPATEPAK